MALTQKRADEKGFVYNYERPYPDRGRTRGGRSSRSSSTLHHEVAISPGYSDRLANRAVVSALPLRARGANSAGGRRSETMERGAGSLAPEPEQDRQVMVW